MGWIKFDRDCGQAKIWFECAAEDGWVFTFDENRALFLVWSNGESEATGKDPDLTCDSLGKVLDAVSTYT